MTTKYYTLEQGLAAFNNCLLGAFVLPKYLKNNKFDFSLYEEDIKVATRLMNIFSDFNEDKHPLQEQIDNDKFGKRIGLEITGFGDICASLGFKYGDNSSKELARTLMRKLLINSIKSSIELAKELSPCAALDTVEKRKKFIESCIYLKDCEEFKSLSGDIIKFGLRNTSFNTVGPCGSISIVSGNITSGIEPVFMFSYKRKNRIDGKEYAFIHLPAAQRMLENYNDFDGLTLKEAKEKLNYFEASEIDYNDRIAVQSAFQKYTDSSISSTINLSNDCSSDDIQNIYKCAWKNNLKGITVFRDGCKNGVLSSINDKHEEQVDITTQEVFEKELFDEEYSVRHRVSWKGSKIYINVSVDEEDSPIEVFTKLPKEAGIGSDGVFNSVTWNEHNSLWDSLCRCISVSLRYGVPLTEIINQLNKSTYSLVDAAGILKRILSKYILNDEEDSLNICSECGERAYVFEGGCGKCLSCGYSSCG